MSSLFGFDLGDNPFGTAGVAGSLVGGLGTAATIYGLYQQNKQQQDNLSYNRNFNADQLAENKREFDLSQQLKEQGLEQSAAAAQAQAAAAQAAVAAQVQAAHSRAIGGAYDSLIQSVENGDAGKAASLSSLVASIQKAYAQH
jgi:hypothetical protein